MSPTRRGSPVVTHGVALAAHTTLAVGGPARAWTDAHDTPAIIAALEWAASRGFEVEVLGGGSNVLVADRGLDALVLHPCPTGLLIRERGEEVNVRAGAGLDLDQLVAWSVERGLAGIECLAGIPGSVGAAPVQNVGAYGQELGGRVRAVHVVDRHSGQPRAWSAEECRFGYRTSAFKAGRPRDFIVVAVDLTLHRRAPDAARYAELARRLEQDGHAPTLASVRAAVLELRRRKSMVLDPADANTRSVGSFFVNPTLSAEEARALRTRVAERLGAEHEPPEHAVPPDRVKIPAAWLIERSGMPPGFGDGRVGLSTKHSLAIVNRGGATASEIVDFAIAVRERVFEQLGVWLTPEVQLLGFRQQEIARLVG